VTAFAFRSKYRPGDNVCPHDLPTDWPIGSPLVTRVQFDWSGCVTYRVRYQGEVESRLLDFRERYKVEVKK
jgi:hypothetical protein